MLPARTQPGIKRVRMECGVTGRCAFAMQVGLDRSRKDQLYIRPIQRRQKAIRQRNQRLRRKRRCPPKAQTWDKRWYQTEAVRRQRRPPGSRDQTAIGALIDGCGLYSTSSKSSNLK